MISQSSIVVVDAQVGGANFAHAELLLLIGAGGHRIAIFLLGQQLLFPILFHFLHELQTLVYFALGTSFFSLGQFLPNGLGQPVDVLSLGRDLGRQLFLRLGQPLLGQLCPSVTIIDERFQMLT